MHAEKKRFGSHRLTRNSWPTSYTNVKGLVAVLLSEIKWDVQWVREFASRSIMMIVKEAHWGTSCVSGSILSSTLFVAAKL